MESSRGGNGQDGTYISLYMAIFWHLYSTYLFEIHVPGGGFGKPCGWKNNYLIFVCDLKRM